MVFLSEAFRFFSPFSQTRLQARCRYSSVPTKVHIKARPRGSLKSLVRVREVGRRTRSMTLPLPEASREQGTDGLCSRFVRARGRLPAWRAFKPLVTPAVRRPKEPRRRPRVILASSAGGCVPNRRPQEELMDVS